MAFTTPDLILFAKQPIPGQVKTRLHERFSPQTAARIATMMIEQTVRLAVSTWPGEVYLYATPDPDFPLFNRLADELHLHLHQQAADDDLGGRMLAALEDGIRRSGSAAVMGCDVPHCPPAVLEQAYECLARGGDVIGPSKDGGYYLIGLQQTRAELFQQIVWGSKKVLITTLSRAKQIGLEFAVLPVLRDLDTVDDLQAVAQTYAPLRHLLEIL